MKNFKVNEVLFLTKKQSYKLQKFQSNLLNYYEMSLNKTLTNEEYPQYKLMIAIEIERAENFIKELKTIHKNIIYEKES